MARLKFQTLTEQMFYVLLCLQTECCGIDLMDRVKEITDGQVQVGSGTLYHLLDEFLYADMIEETRAEGRRRSYILTDKGRQALQNERSRLLRQVRDYDRFFGEE